MQMPSGRRPQLGERLGASVLFVPYLKEDVTRVRSRPGCFSLQALGTVFILAMAAPEVTSQVRSQSHRQREWFTYVHSNSSVLVCWKMWQS